MDQRVRRILAFAIASAIISFAFHVMMRSSAGQPTDIRAISKSKSASSDTAAMLNRLDDAVNVSKEMNSQADQAGTAKPASDMLHSLRN